MKNTFLLIFVWLLASGSYASDDARISFAGLKDNTWKIFIGDAKGNYRTVDSIKYPRDFSISPDGKQLVYVGADAAIRLLDMQSNKTSKINSWDSAKYTQPRFSASGKLYAVRMESGRSRSTQLVEIDLKKQTYTKNVAKRTAQFNPHMAINGLLYYTTALCVDDCEKMIWELWYRDGDTGIQEQMTLLNALSRQPVYSQKENSLYFVSNAEEGFHIWNMPAVVGAKPQRLTQGAAQYTDPVVDRNGQLYYLEKASGKKNLLTHFKGEEQKILPLPKGVSAIRNLEVW